MEKRIDAPPEVKQIQSELPDIRQRVGEIVISSDADVDAANAFVVEIRGRRKTLETAKKAMVDPVNGFFNPLINELKDREKAVASAVSSYALEQKRLADARMKEAEEIARRETEKRKKQLEARAEKWEQKGDVERAAELREEAATTISLQPMMDVPQLSIKSDDGRRTTLVDDIEVNVVDEQAFVCAVVSGKFPIWDAIKVNPGPIKRYIKMTRINDIPGVFVREVVSPRFFGGKQ